MTRSIARALGLTAVVAFLWISTATAESTTLHLQFDAAGQQRSSAPVSVLVQLPASLGEVEVVELTLPEGKTVLGQLTDPGLLAEVPKPAEGKVVRQLHFIVPSLAEGQKLTATVAIDTDQPAAEKKFAWKDTAGEHADLLYNGKPVLRYMYAALDTSSPEARERTYKVYHHVFDPHGTRVLTKGPGGLYTHHRGLFYGFNRISYEGHPRVDTWHCGGKAHQAHAGFLSQEAGPVLGRHRVAIDWHAGDDPAFANEQREMTVYAVPGGHLIEFASRLKSNVGEVKLDGDPQHAGFQFRAAQEVAAENQKQTYYLRPDGKGEPGKTRNWSSKARDPKTANLPWNAMSFVLGDQRYTAVYLDRPENPKEARYSERPYGRFGSYFEYELAGEETLDLNYRVWVQRGELTVDEAAALRGDFVEPIHVSVGRKN
jgi:hypothetical protein